MSRPAAVSVSQWVPLRENQPAVNQPRMAAFGYRHRAKPGTLVTLWCNDARPADAYEPRATTVTVDGAFTRPVLVDLLTGRVYEIPRKQWKQAGTRHTFTGIPVADYPVLIAEKKRPADGVNEVIVKGLHG